MGHIGDKYSPSTFMNDGIGIPSYAQYRESGLSWLPKIPLDWTTIRLKYSVTCCRNGIWGDDPDGVNDIICVRVADFDRSRFRVRIDSPTLRAVTKTERRLRLLRKGDLLLEKSGGGDLQPVGCVMLYGHTDDAVCSNFVAKMTPRDGFDPSFLCYLHASLYSARLNRCSIKQNTGIQNLDSDAYLDEKVPIPPPVEQRGIVAFLDRETARIDAMIAKKEQLIDLLKEKRTALISALVTGKLSLIEDPATGRSRPVDDAELARLIQQAPAPKILLDTSHRKPSGIPWLGDIPKHWEIIPTGRLVKIGNGSTPSRSDDRYWTEGQIPWLTSGKVHEREVRNADQFVTEIARYECHLPLVPAGSLLLAITGEGKTRGTVAVTRITTTISQHLAYMTPRAGRVNPDFLLWYFGSLYEFLRSESSGDGSTKAAITCEYLRGVAVATPREEEQVTIADFLSLQTEGIAVLIDKNKEVIAKLQEHRAALITATVTGQIDIRECEGTPDNPESGDTLDPVLSSGAPMDSQDKVSHGILNGAQIATDLRNSYVELSELAALPSTSLNEAARRVALQWEGIDKNIGVEAYKYNENLMKALRPAEDLRKQYDSISSFSKKAMRGSLGTVQEAQQMYAAFLRHNDDAIRRAARPLEEYQNRYIEAFCKQDDAVRRAMCPIEEAQRSYLATFSQHQEAMEKLVQSVLGWEKNRAASYLGVMRAAHSSWTSRSVPASWETAQANVAKSLAEISGAAALSCQLFGRVDYAKIQKTLSVPDTMMRSLVKTVDSSLTSYDKFVRTIHSPTDVMRLPEFILPGATREIATTGYVLTSLDIEEDAPQSSSETTQEERGRIEDMRCEELLHRLHPDLVIPYRGARDALTSNSVDHVRHVLTSLRELWTHVLHHVAPDASIREWRNDSKYYHEGRPTRSARVLYVCRGLCTDTFSTFLDNDTKGLIDLIRFLNRVHEINPNVTRAQLKALFLKTETWLLYLLQINEETGR